MHIIKLLRHTRDYWVFMTICGTNVTVTMTQHRSPLGRDILKMRDCALQCPVSSRNRNPKTMGHQVTCWGKGKG